jgi:hypothetical protein
MVDESSTVGGYMDPPLPEGIEGEGSAGADAEGRDVRLPILPDLRWDSVECVSPMLNVSERSSYYITCNDQEVKKR